MHQAAKDSCYPLAPDRAALGCADRPLAAWCLVVMLPPASSGATAGSASASPSGLTSLCTVCSPSLSPSGPSEPAALGGASLNPSEPAALGGVYSVQRLPLVPQLKEQTPPLQKPLKRPASCCGNAASFEAYTAFGPFGASALAAASNSSSRLLISSRTVLTFWAKSATRRYVQCAKIIAADNYRYL